MFIVSIAAKWQRGEEGFRKTFKSVCKNYNSDEIVLNSF